MISRARAVIDASVVVKWYISEADTPTALQVRATTLLRLAPDLLAAEFGNILWKKVRQGEIAAADAASIVGSFTATCPIDLIDSVPLLQSAIDIATTYNRTVYDALYAALAIAEDCQVITADDRLVRALANTPLAARVVLLANA